MAVRAVVRVVAVAVFAGVAARFFFANASRIAAAIIKLLSLLSVTVLEG